MNLELLNTLASIGTFVVIGATAIAAVVQLRHMRNNNQLTGLLEVLSRVENPVFNEWMDRTKPAIARDLQDPQFRRIVARGDFARENNPWLNVLNSYEWVGSLIKYRLIPEEPFMDVYSGRILSAWGVLEPLFAVAPRRGDPSLWENFEYLVVRAREGKRRFRAARIPKARRACSGLPKIR